MNGTTYQALIRLYAKSVQDGAFDRDLTPRQARLTAVVLNTASNDYRATVVHPPTDQTRDEVIQTLSNTLWNGNARAIAQAISPAADKDLDLAIQRAVVILRGI